MCPKIPPFTKFKYMCPQKGFPVVNASRARASCCHGVFLKIGVPTVMATRVWGEA